MWNKSILKNKYAVVLLLVLSLNSFSCFAKGNNPSSLIQFASGKNYLTNWNGKESEMEILSYLTDINNCDKKLSDEEIAESAREIGFNYSILGNHLLGTYYFNYAVQLVPNNADYRLDLALELWSIGKTDMAKKEFDNAYKLDSTKSDLLKMYGHFYFCQNQFPKAVEFYTKSLKYNDGEYNSNYQYIMRYIAELHIDKNKRQTKIVSESREWPYQIVQYINGEMDESGLTEYIKNQKDENGIREKLCEALYYLGSYKIATGDTLNGELMIDQCLNTRLPAFVEYTMALSHVAEK
jgi:lipoprotein NlpI